MAVPVKLTKYAIRGRCKVTGKQYKVVRGQVRQLHEARGEDQFDSVFFAIFAASRAAKNWRFMSSSVIFNIEPLEAGELEC